MSSRSTTSHALHDIGGAVWLGGSLMGAVGLNGASRAVDDPSDRVAVASAGWARWSPVNAAAIGTHLLGGLGLLLANRDRVQKNPGVTVNTIAKLVVTGAALGATGYSGLLGAKLAKAGKVPALGGVLPTDSTPQEVAATQQQLRVLQWTIPALTAAIIALGSQQNEQQHQSAPPPRRGLRTLTSSALASFPRPR